MSYNSNLPEDIDIKVSRAEVRENLRALKEDKIVDAATAVAADSAAKLTTARKISLEGDATGSTSFDGSADVAIQVDVLSADTSAQCTGNAATATKLETARTINGVEFDGTKDIIVPTIAPRCKAHLTTNVSIPSGVTTSIPMQVVDYDTDNIHTADPTKFQINTSGVYLIVHQNYIPKTSTWDDMWTVNVILEKNEKEYLAVTQPAIDGNISALVYLSAGDYIKAKVYQTSGKTFTTQFGTDGTVSCWPYISIVKISD
ncbi:MAG: hypothetical protein H6Q70_3952 [Firmicutes bacterium]|nr:hypothetical protein [Bacillota bacterium]